MARILTRAKQKWADSHKPKVLLGTPLNPNISDAIKYKRKLSRLIDLMTNEVEKQIKKLFETEHAEEYFAQDASISSQARILTNALTKKFEDLFASIAKPLAEQVANNADKSSSIALHSSLAELSGGLSLKTTGLSSDLLDVVNATITENVGLIKSIPTQYLEGVQGAVMRSITGGRGMADLVPYLQAHKSITNRRANLIALDQTRKAFNNLNKGRMQKLGIKQFKWLHSGGSNEPRKQHIEMSGKIYDIDNPPFIGVMYGAQVFGFPGQLPNCRCRMLPVIKFSED